MAAEIYLVAGVLIAGAALAKIAEQYRFPYPILLILAGIILGQAIPPEVILESGLELDFIAQLTLAIILFYAGLNMNLKELRLSILSVILLATLGVLLTSLIAGVTIELFSITITLSAALLIGAILSPTDPAALFSVLETGGIRVKKKLFSILEGEAVFNDATAVILVVTVFLPFVVPGPVQLWYFIVGEFILSMLLGIGIGFVVAYVIGKIILSPIGDTNTSVLTATTPILAYGIGELFAYVDIHPGALAAVFAGIFMANSRRMGLDALPQKSMRGVMKNLSFAFEIAVFVLLGLTLDINGLIGNVPLIGLGLLIAFLVIFVARPASVFLVTAPDRSMTMKERFFVSWAGVKGVASAALAAIAVAAMSNVPGITIEEQQLLIALGQDISAIVFIVLMVSLIVQGLTTPILATRMKLIEEHDSAKEITAHRDATRFALLQLVDQYTEGNLESQLYTRLKSELEEEIYKLEDELRRVVSERRALLKELDIRESIYQSKLSFFESEYEKGKLSEGTLEDQRKHLEEELNEIANLKRIWKEGRNP